MSSSNGSIRVTLDMGKEGLGLRVSVVDMRQKFDTHLLSSLCVILKGLRSLVSMNQEFRSGI